MNIKDINRIVELMTANDLTEIDIKFEDMSLTIRREPSQKDPTQVAAPLAPIAAAPAFVMSPPAASERTTTVDNGTETIVEDAGTVDSPLVGTFYAAASPEAEPFAKVGDSVDEDTIVCIVEAMKVMNEIKAGQKGTIAKMLVDNGQPVEFGQPLFLIRR